MKRTFLQLAHQYDPKKYIIDQWFVSEKLDGMRAFWDGGLSRGKLAAEIPWANTVKDVNDRIATGLWSRMGKVISAPDYFLDHFPNFPLDGELWLDRGQFQSLVSITKSHTADDRWKFVKYYVFDSPSYESIFKDGEIEIRYASEKYSVHLKSVMKWVKEVGQGRFRYLNPNASFETVYRWLDQNLEHNSVVHLLKQTLINNEKDLENIYQKVLAVGGEGVILRFAKSCWQPARVHTCLKYKPFEIDEGTVIGYTWGREGKLLGKMGALIVNYKGQQLKVSGFTDEERIMIQSSFDSVGEQNPGSLVTGEFENPKYKRGSKLRFMYRELTDSGLPKEARRCANA